MAFHEQNCMAMCNSQGATTLDVLFTIMQRVIVAPFYPTSTHGFVSMIIPLLPRIGSLPLRKALSMLAWSSSFQPSYKGIFFLQHDVDFSSSRLQLEIPTHISPFVPCVFHKIPRKRLPNKIRMFTVHLHW